MRHVALSILTREHAGDEALPESPQKALALLGLSDIGKLRRRVQSAFDYYLMSFGLESVGRLTRCRISAPHYDTIRSPFLPTSLDSVTYPSVFLAHALPFSKSDS